MRTCVHPPTDVARVSERITRGLPQRQLAITWLAAGAEEPAPCVSARWNVPPTLGLGEAHGSLDVPVGVNRASHPRLQTLTIFIDSRSSRNRQSYA